MRGVSYVRTVVVVHGASERILCESIGANLRLPMKIIANKNGAASIQINGLSKFLKKSCLKSHEALLSECPRIQSDKGKAVNIKIFTIMDTDDCNDNKLLASYKDGSIFSQSAFSDAITPIFNSPKLDSVMEHIGHPIDEKQKTKSYSKIFPGESGDIETAVKLRDEVSSLSETNLCIFLNHCIEESRKDSLRK